MENTVFLYGAAVQGIQDFIFQTNELKDIVGASGLVEHICTTAFDEFADSGGFNGEDPDSIVRAAGNIKYIFRSERACRRAVREFPRKVMEMAPGITISQAVVRMNDGMDFSEAVDALENRLQIQRNRLVRSATMGLLGIRRSRKTGLPAVEERNGEFWDEATLRKREMSQPVNVCEKAFGHKVEAGRVAFLTQDMTDRNDWIAIIHADGNSLGTVVRCIGRRKEAFARFSKALDQVTRAAAVRAYEDLGGEDTFQGKIPIRPVVLSGDDLTVILRGDLAIPYIRSFLAYFETLTAEDDAIKDLVKTGKGLTACAGIAFMKSSYPFYYGYRLAEELCGRAKRSAKRIDAELAPSCLMFHKVQDSFVEDFDEIARRELTPAPGHSFEFGPYFLEEQAGYARIDDLTRWTGALSVRENKAVKGHLRQWIGWMYRGDARVGLAEQKKRRLKVLWEGKSATWEWVDALLSGLTAEDGEGNAIRKYPVYDVLSLLTIHHQKTR